MPLACDCQDKPGMNGMGEIVRRTAAEVLYDYALGELRAGRRFYISPELNSERFGQSSGMGFWAALMAAAVKVAGTVAAVAKPVAQVAAVVNSVKGQATASSGSGVSADDIVSAILPQVRAQLEAQGVTLPGAVAKEAVSASILDAFGPQYHNLVLYGGLALAALVLFKMMKG